MNRGTIYVNSLRKTVTRQRRGSDLNQGPSAPESSTLTTLRRKFVRKFEFSVYDDLVILEILRECVDTGSTTMTMTTTATQNSDSGDVTLVLSIGKTTAALF